MSKSLKIGIAIFTLAALIISVFFIGNMLEIKTSRIFIPLFFIGIIGIWVIQFRMEKKNIEEEERE